MRADATALVANARIARQQALAAQKALAEVEQALRERQRSLAKCSGDLETVQGKLRHSSLDLETGAH
jgi:hypothetical protein